MTITSLVGAVVIGFVIGYVLAQIAIALLGEE